MRLESLGAVHTHPPSLYRLIKNKISNIEIDKGELYSNVDRHK